MHSSVVPHDTVQVVQLATSASESSVLSKYGLPVGLFLGLMVGLIIALIAERLDPRADHASEVAEVFGRPVAMVPSELSVPEFGHAVLNDDGAKRTMTLAPLRWWDVPAAYSIERTLAPDYPDTTIYRQPGPRRRHGAPARRELRGRPGGQVGRAHAKPSGTRWSGCA